MLLSVEEVDIALGAVVFRFTVPGHQRWALRSIHAVAIRDAGGVPSRVYTLTVTDGTTIVAQVGAADAGTEPGTCAVTWADLPAASVATGPDGITVAPLPPVTLNPGYQIVGSIDNGAPADMWSSAVAWFEFVYTT